MCGGVGGERDAGECGAVKVMSAQQSIGTMAVVNSGNVGGAFKHSLELICFHCNWFATNGAYAACVLEQLVSMKT